MSDLLLNWLNDEVQLSKRITNFQEDFHNGFLFGQLLAKHSQQLNFHEFIDKDDKASRINNFSHLLQTFTALRITYDSNIAMKIISRQLGVTKKLLYELKTQLEKTNDNAFTKTNRLSKTLTPLKKIQISKEKFDQIHKEHFVKQLNELHPAQKEIIQQKLLKKFSDFEQKTNVKASMEQQKQRQSKLFMISKFHDQQRENLKKSQQFRKQWEAQNSEKWANNMTLRHAQIMKDEHYKSKQQELKIFTKTSSQVNALKALESDIAQFQRKNLKSRKGIIESSSESQDQEKQVKLSKKQSSKEKGSPEPRQQRRIPAGQNEKKKHQRQKRRRKMIVQQLKKYQLVEIARRQRCIIATIEQTSKQEKEIQYEIWRAWQNKNIINENKQLQTKKIQQKSEVRQTNAKFKHDQLLKTYRQEHKHQVQAGLKSNVTLQRTNSVKQRKQIYSECQKMVLNFLDITEKMYNSCQQTNSSIIIEEQLDDQLVKFVENTKGEQQGLLKLKHYIGGSHEWNLPITRPQEQVSLNPTQDNALPNENVNNYYLGNILKFVFQKQLKAVSQAENIENNKIVLSLVGLDFGKKHLLANMIKEKYNFNVILVQKLIEDKLKDWAQLKSKGVEISQETQQLAEQCYSGKDINDTIIIKLIQQSIQKHEKSIVVDYPNTYNQAIELCKVIGGVQPQDLIANNKLSQKIQQFSRLVRPSETKLIQRDIKSCGIDFVWWINVSVQNSLDRMLGRRWIGQQEVHIFDDIDANKIVQGQKAASLISRNHFKLKNKSKLKEWFSLFGINNKMEEVTKRCWQEIQGNTTKDQLQAQILTKIEQTISVKESYKKYLQKQRELQKQNAIKRQEEIKNKEEIKKKCVRSTPENLKSQLKIALNKVQIQKDFVQKIAELWNKSQNTTVNCLTKAFLSLQQQHRARQSYLAAIKRNFIGLLMREDHKFHLIKDFQINYNKFLSENEDMLVHDYTKEELHQRVEDLENDLLSIVQEKKQDALAERAAVMSSGWLESQIEIIYESLYLLIQTQMNRFGVSQKIIIDFYSKKYMCSTKGFEPLSPELNSQAYAALDNYKDKSCPKLDKMISEAFRILNREEEVVEDKNKKGGKGAPPAKKDDKKGAKKGGKDEVEEVKEPTKEQLEMKRAINTQKAILRQRLNKIKTLGSSRVKHTFQTIQKLYIELQDLYVYTNKVQQKAIYGLSKIFKKSIELQQKIEYQVQIKYVQVSQTEAIRNFHKPQPIILPAKERIVQDNFTLSNLKQIFVFIGEQSEGNVISTKRLTILLHRLTSNLQLKAMLPINWKHLKPAQLESFVKILDNTNSGYVDLITLFTFFVFGNFKYPTQTEIQGYTLELTNYSSLKELTEEEFVEKNSWFDQQAEFVQNVRIFERSRHLKSILFGIFENKSKTLQINRYLDVITLKNLDLNRQIKAGEQTYFDIAFT